jgi:uncharacterized membrane protein YagU involved in acid resistance
MKTLLESGLIIGIADGIAAVTSAYLTRGTTPDRVFQYVASGAIGKDAFSGGMPIVLLGILFHFFIAFNFTAFFYFLANKQKWLLDKIYFYGAIYGVFIWLIMNFIVIPLSQITRSSFTPTGVAIGLLIHIFVIGIPIAWLTKRNFVRG